MACNRILYAVDLVCPEMTKIAQFVMPKMLKITHNLLCKNVENHATLVEGFWPEFYPRGRFMKYSMSAAHIIYSNQDGTDILFSCHY